MNNSLIVKLDTNDHNVYFNYLSYIFNTKAAVNQLDTLANHNLKVVSKLLS